MQTETETDPGAVIPEIAPVIPVIKAIEETDSLIMIITDNIPDLQMTLMNMMLGIMHKTENLQMIMIRMIIRVFIGQVQVQDSLTLLMLMVLRGMAGQVQEFQMVMVLRVMRGLAGLVPGIQALLMLMVVRGLVGQVLDFQTVLTLMVVRGMADLVPGYQKVLMIMVVRGLADLVPGLQTVLMIMVVRGLEEQVQCS